MKLSKRRRNGQNIAAYTCAHVVDEESAPRHAHEVIIWTAGCVLSNREPAAIVKAVIVTFPHCGHF